MALTGDTFDFQQGNVITSSAQIVDSGATVGDVLTVQADKSIAAAPGGGTQPGARRTLKFPFDFTMADDLAVGVPVWTPTVGDWLLGAWIETDDAWAANAVGAQADIGVVLAGAWANVGGSPQGIFAAIQGPPVELGDATWVVDTQLVTYQQHAQPTDLEQGMLINQAGGGALPIRIKFRTTDPLSLVVSGDGTPSGDPTDAASGASTLFIEVSTPAATP